MIVGIDLTDLLAHAPEYYHRETLANIMIRVNRSIDGRITFDMVMLDNYKRGIAYAHQQAKETVIHALEAPLSLPNPMWAMWLLLRDQAMVTLLGNTAKIDEGVFHSAKDEKDFLAKSTCCNNLIIFREDGWLCSGCNIELDENGNPKAKQFLCHDCTNIDCKQPRETKDGQPKYWSYMGACGHKPSKGAKKE